MTEPITRERPIVARICTECREEITHRWMCSAKACPIFFQAIPTQEPPGCPTPGACSCPPETTERRKGQRRVDTKSGWVASTRHCDRRQPPAEERGGRERRSDIESDAYLAGARRVLKDRRRTVGTRADRASIITGLPQTQAIFTEAMNLDDCPIHGKAWCSCPLPTKEKPDPAVTQRLLDRAEDQSAGLIEPTRHLGISVAPHQPEASAAQPVSLIEELEIESRIVPHRRGELYAIAAREIAAVGTERNRLHKTATDLGVSVGKLLAENDDLRATADRALAEANALLRELREDLGGSYWIRSTLEKIDAHLKAGNG